MSQIKVIGNANLMFGNLHIVGKTYGEVIDASIKLTGDGEGVPDDMAGFQAYILSNDTYEISFEAVIPSTVPLPARGDRVDVGKINVAANILDWELMAPAGKANRIKINCSHWVSIGGAIGVGAPVTPVASNLAPASED